jgi:hypothetical protein
MIIQNSPATITIYMVADTDHISGVAGADVSISLSKSGSAFTPVTRTINEIGDGWYAVQLLPADTDVVGDLLIRSSAPTADDSVRATAVVASAGDWTPAEIAQIRQALGITGATSPTEAGDLQYVKALQANKRVIDKAAKTMTIYNTDGVTPLLVFDLQDSTGTPSVTEIAKTIPR